MGLPSFSVVIPAFNEEASIEAVLTRVLTHVGTLRSRYDVDVVVVDDGSSDGTLDTLHHVSVDNPESLTVVAHERNAGLTAAMRSGALAARSGTVVFLDADLSYSPEILEALVRARTDAGAAAALASPYMNGGYVANVPPVRLLASRVANAILTRCARGRLHTFTGMVRAYDRAEFLALGERTPVGEFNTWAVAELLAGGARVVEIPAGLVWPKERTSAPSRLTMGKLWERTLLVVKTARFLAAAVREGDRNRGPGTLVLSNQTTGPCSPKP
jgi:dolichol-phosphate mannosyltransferase